MKLWGGRFEKSTNKLVEEYTASIQFDQQLVIEDILGSLAHVRMLGEQGIILKQEADQITVGLKKILESAHDGKLTFSIHDEDIHMNIERLLSEDIGELSGKLHTGRSRNDQVALDMHMYLRRKVLEIGQRVLQLVNVLHSQAVQNLDVIVPGYTHLQRAQPILFAHHLLAYAHKFERDLDRLLDSFKRINISPLGSGALAGSSFPLNRLRVAELLNFEGVYENSLDAVSDRDFIVEFLSNSALIITHLSRLSEELIVWSSTEFNFIELDDAFCTGSSIMPQKKNPDVPELVRGKTGRIYGNLMGLLTVLKGLPLAYNKDLQEDKEGMFDAVKTLEGALDLYVPMLDSMKINKDRMAAAVAEDFSNATDLADYLAKHGLPFRQAHEVIGKLVNSCIKDHKLLIDLSLEDLQSFSPLFKADAFEVIKPLNVVKARNTRGGTAPEQVSFQAKLIAERMNQKEIGLNKLLNLISDYSVLFAN